MKSLIKTIALVVAFASYAHAVDLNEDTKVCSSADSTQTVIVKQDKATALGIIYKMDQVTIVETEIHVLQEPTDQIPQLVYSAYHRISRKDGGPMLFNDVFSTGDYVVCRIVK